MPRVTYPTAAPYIPEHATLAELSASSQACKGCPLYEKATQTVFGEGEPTARVMLIGEQPGDQEDLQGHPFVGPAGQLLDRALEQAGIDRRLAYVTNTVKHFKWEPKGKRRIHVKPAAAEINACVPWLKAEIALLRPEVIVCLGATAAQALLGKEFRVTQDRGRVMETPIGQVLATIHPSAVLRAPDEAAREGMFAGLVADLQVVASVMPSLSGAS